MSSHEYQSPAPLEDGLSGDHTAGDGAVIERLLLPDSLSRYPPVGRRFAASPPAPHTWVTEQSIRNREAFAFRQCGLPSSGSEPPRNPHLHGDSWCCPAVAPVPNRHHRSGTVPAGASRRKPACYEYQTRDRRRNTTAGPIEQTPAFRGPDGRGATAPRGDWLCTSQWGRYRNRTCNSQINILVLCQLS